jgi:hypothetical protein
MYSAKIPWLSPLTGRLSSPKSSLRPCPPLGWAGSQYIDPPTTNGEFHELQDGFVFRGRDRNGHSRDVRFSRDAALELFEERARIGLRMNDWARDHGVTRAFREVRERLRFNDPRSFSDAFMSVGERFNGGPPENDPIQEVVRRFTHQTALSNESPFKNTDVAAFSAHLGAYWQQASNLDLKAKYAIIMAYFISDTPFVGSFNVMRMTRQIESMLSRMASREKPVDKRIRTLHHLLLARALYEHEFYEYNEYYTSGCNGEGNRLSGIQRLLLGKFYARRAISGIADPKSPITGYADTLQDDITTLLSKLRRPRTRYERICDVDLGMGFGDDSLWGDPDGYRWSRWLPRR